MKNLLAAVLLLIAGSAQAALIDRGEGCTYDLSESCLAGLAWLRRKAA